MNDPTVHPASLAIVGMACRFPGADTPEKFWANIEAGVDSVRPFTDEELDRWSGGAERPADPRYVNRHGVVDGVGDFDAGFFGYTSRDATMLNPEQRLFLECSWEALERAGYDPANVPGVVGVYGGAARNGYGNIVREHRFAGADEFAVNLANDPEHLCSRVAYKLGLTGPAVAVMSVCSTSLVAVHEAGLALLAGDCDTALAGGVSIQLPRRGYWFQENGVMSPEGRCRAFDAGAAGIVAGDGAGVVVLRRLADALDDGDPVLAVVRGSAVNNDGRRRPGFTAPSVQGQSEVVRAAHAVAGVSPASIGYVEAHGTGTPVGDPIEISALTDAFGAADLPPGSIPIGSVKTNIGHTDTAAGAASLIKTVMMLRHRRIAPSLGFDAPNPEIDFAATPFAVATQSRPWESPGRPRRAGVSSFGIGGVNAHAVLEEAPERPGRGPVSTRPELFVLSARTPEALTTMAGNLLDHLSRHPGERPDEVARTLQTGRHAFGYRGHLVWPPAPGTQPRFHRSPAPAGDPTVAFLLPGQGSLRPGMTRQLYDEVPGFRAVLDECCELFRPVLGADLRELLYSADPGAAGEALERIEYAQPALFAIDYAIARTWTDQGVVPGAMIGHSLGELVAACLAGVLTLPDAVATIGLRAAVLAGMPPGAMLAVSLPDERVRELVDGETLGLAAINGPQQCVVAGTPERVAELAARLREQGVHSRPVAAGGAYHTPLMDPAVDKFRGHLAAVTLRPPSIPYVSTISGDWITDAQATDPDFWARQLSSPVLFEPALRTLLATTADGVLLETGPGQALSSMATLRPKESRRRALPSLGDVTKAGDEVGALLNTAGQLWQAGVPVDWRRRHPEQPVPRVTLPTYPFQRQTHLVFPPHEPAAAPRRDAAPEPPAAAPGPVRQRILLMFQQILGCDEQLDDPHFFEQGGDSLTAMQLTTLLDEAFGVAPPLETVFDAPTVSELSAIVERLTARPEPA
ncbi:type I polyketide synthase [Pseudosporangium ferrugineum]|uniref:Acyl transferase domain-containing protein n=1 Tax=Pseudosporangium ferrugineum TaxID=439699 RepID=A0A2T0SB75_9ACTN|nr:type I polyketide synthase [Pseudosporangium ferrugineum]PRY30675.1 acyl transferase domain-containing protein [Pseudosporangium ferrugineum]